MHDDVPSIDHTAARTCAEIFSFIFNIIGASPPPADASSILLLAQPHERSSGQMHRIVCANSGAFDHHDAMMHTYNTYDVRVPTQTTRTPGCT